jgi:hypothetical protein
MTISFALVGGAWRAEFYLRIARDLPDRFSVCGIVVSTIEEGRLLEAAWAVPTFRSIDDMLRTTSPQFVVTCAPRDINVLVLIQLARDGVAVLSETPPARDIGRLRHVWSMVEQGARIQVAEQTAYQPRHAARLAIIGDGLLGRISEAQVSVCHGYHGVSLIRRSLGIGFENAEITARRFVSPIIGGPGRNGPPTEERLEQSAQVIAWLDFGDSLGVYDFAVDQYFSWIRGRRFLVRGERGEMIDERASYVVDYRQPIDIVMQRAVAGANGNLEGLYLKGIEAGGRWVYRNPFIPARLTDEEIAIATVLAKMGDYVAGGPEVYSLANACQDRYLDIMIAKAVDLQQPVQTETQPRAWGASVATRRASLGFT